MKKKRLFMCILMASLFTSLGASNVFASNTYNISYSGGQPLSESNLNIDPGLVKSLTRLVRSDKNIEYSVSDKWFDAYIKTNTSCIAVKYFKIWQNNQISEDDNLYYSFSNGQYKTVVQFENVEIENVSGVSEGGSFLPVVVNNGSVSHNAGLYTDEQCTARVSGAKTVSYANNDFIFIQVKLKMYEYDVPFESNEMYFGITDVDAGQSYKILNSANKLSASNMYALSVEAVTPTDTELRNMFVSSEGYIYSQYSDKGFDIPTNGDIFVKIDPAVQKEGLDLVFGFATGAGSGLRYYAKQYDVKYVSSEGGEISGITEESIISGRNPSGTLTKPSDGYEFVYWTADNDVKLGDGTIIKAGSKITSEQIKKISVDNNIVFTAFYAPIEDSIVVPNTGKFTEEMNAALVAMPIVGIVIIAISIAILPRLRHKKISF